VSALSHGEGLLFLHGAGGSRFVWQHQALAFPRARILDLPGRAGGAPSGVDGYLDAIRASLKLDIRGPAAPHVVAGHSLGSAIALQWALRYPDEVRGLILVGAGAKMRVNPAWLAGIAAGEREAIEEFGAWWFGPAAQPRLREKSLALLRATPPEVLLADLRAADAFDVMADLGRVAVPTLIICGADDRLTPVKFSRYLHEQIRDADLVVVDDAGHMVMLEQPGVVTAAIAQFLARLERTGTEGAP
jgi:pimeloyl-ACP methyl ester carboxylesterase